MLARTLTVSSIFLGGYKKNVIWRQWNQRRNQRRRNGNVIGEVGRLVFLLEESEDDKDIVGLGTDN